jgi:hypothetical protein
MSCTDGVALEAVDGVGGVLGRVVETGGCGLCDLACLLYVLWWPYGLVAHLCVAWEHLLMSWSSTVT